MPDQKTKEQKTAAPTIIITTDDGKKKTVNGFEEAVNYIYGDDDDN